MMLLLFLYPVHGFLPYLPKIYDYLKHGAQSNFLDFLNLIKATGYLDTLEANSTISECVEKLRQMANHFMTDPAMTSFARHSGKGLGDIGDYDTCEATNTSYYAIFFLKVNYAAGVRTAFCVPRECRPEVVELTKPFLAAAANYAVNGKFTAKQITFEFPKADNTVLNKLRPGGWAFYLGSFALIAFSLAITALDRYGYFAAEDPQPTTWKKVAVCFSLSRNLKSVFSTENTRDPKLNVLNGIRVLSICWIVTGHFAVALGISPVANLPELAHSVFHSVFMGFVKSGNLASDAFFFLSGFFSAMSVFRLLAHPENRTGKMVLWLYLRRYIRLFPVFMFGILGATFIMPTMYDSPLSSWAKPQVRMCEEQWVYCLLYVNNFVSGFYDSCMAWLWYLHVDMQFFLLVPLLFLLYFYRKQLMFITMGIISLISLVAQVWIIGYYKYSLSAAKLDHKNDMNTMVFMKPYCRIWTYLMGIFLYLMYEDHDTPQPFLSFKRFILTQTAIRRLSYLLALTMIALSVYSFFYLDHCPECWGAAFGVFHMIAIRPFFTLALAALVYPALIGRAKFLLSLLGHYIFCHISKVTYGIYMFHLPLIGIMRFINTHGRIILPFDIVVGSFTILLMSYVFSGVVTVLYQYPVMLMLKTFVEKNMAKLHSSPSEEKTKAINEYE